MDLLLQATPQVSLDFVTLLGLFSVLSFVGWAVWVKRKNPTLTFGDIINKIFLIEKVTIFVSALIFIGFSEAVMAASIRPEGEFPINGLARFFGHCSIQLPAVVCGIYFSILLPMIFQAIRDRELVWVNRTILAIVMLVGAVALPWANALLITGGLGEAHLFSLFMRSWDWRIFNSMTYVSKAATIMLVGHYFLTFIDGMMVALGEKDDMRKALEESMKGKDGRDINEKINDKDEKSKKQQIKDLPDAVKYLLKRAGYEEGKDLEGMLGNATKVIDNLKSDQAKANLAGKVSGIYKRIKEFDKGDHSDSEKKKQNEKFRKQISSLFSGSPKNGNGFGLNLKKKGK